jgi:inner membrane protein
LDSLTQAALGAAIGGVFFGKEKGSRAIWTGAAVATLPDLDVVLYAFYDSLEMLSIHRGLSHSFFFSTLAGLVVAYVLSRIKMWSAISFWPLAAFSWACLYTHILLDAFTAYGTQLWAPFSAQRVGLDSINVVDPVYTLPLLLGIFAALWIGRSSKDAWKYNRWGLYVSTAYLFLTLANKQNIKTIVRTDMAQQGVETEALMTMPVGAANIRWYGVGKTSDSIFLRQYDLAGRAHGPMEGFAIQDSLLDMVDPEVAECMRWFAKGFYTVQRTDTSIRVYNLQVDMRGVVHDGDTDAPTRGYFEITPREGKDGFGSGSH